jgi:hypothetical protein
MSFYENALFRSPRVVLGWLSVAVVAIGALSLVSLVLGGCAAAPIQLECGEQRFRLDNETLSEDQRRFAEEALKDCEDRLKTAQDKDSAAIENLNQRFTPGDSL